MPRACAKIALMQLYQCKQGSIAGTSYKEIIKIARLAYHNIQKRTPRRACYIRSRQFRKDKIFINQFWDHLNQKTPADRLRRIKLFNCALEVIRNSPYKPESLQNPSKPTETLHRFGGKTKNGELFYVQIKENNKNSRKYFMSVFPANSIKSKGLPQV